MTNNVSVSQMLEDCAETRSCRNHPFNAWELEFIESLLDRLDAGRPFTDRQEELLEKIWDKI